jgi:hypothetical protein
MISFSGGKISVFSTIAERNTWVLNNPAPDGVVLVLDASGDSEITSGKAWYQYHKNNWIRISKEEEPVSDIQEVNLVVSNNSVHLEHKPLGDVIIYPRYIKTNEHDNDIWNIIYGTTVTEVELNGIPHWKVEFITSTGADLEGATVTFSYVKSNFIVGGKCVYTDLDTAISPAGNKAVTGAGIYNYLNNRLLTHPENLEDGTIAVAEGGNWNIAHFKDTKLKELVDEAIFKTYSSRVLPATGHKPFSFIESYENLPTPTLNLMGVEIQIFGEEDVYRCVPTVYPPDSDDDMVWEIV